MAPVDVVVVSYNNRDSLRQNVEKLAALPSVHVFVVDNNSPDETLETVRDLPVTAIQLPANKGFAHGVNVGWRSGGSPYVLLLNPDARIDAASLQTLVGALEDAPKLGAVAPRIVDADGSLDFSQRRYPSLRSTYAQALFLHRLFPTASWTDEVVRDRSAYGHRRSPDWVSGACILVRRQALVDLAGLDERFFMYAEDIDFCRRLRDHGYDLLFVPEAVVQHDGGGSGLRTELLPVLATSRLRYASKHRRRPAAALERLGIALGSMTHTLVGRGGRAGKLGHLRALRASVWPPTPD